jgi:hypothetical protein
MDIARYVPMNQLVAQETREQTICQACLNFFSRVPKPGQGFSEELTSLLSPWDLPESSRSCCSCWTVLAALLRLYASAVDFEGETVSSLTDKCRELFWDRPLQAIWEEASVLAAPGFCTQIQLRPKKRLGFHMSETHLEVWAKHSKPQILNDIVLSFS